ncbi:QsdR family transcriptional regulator [Planosporangium thailandense]|uniref:QsdR family transcriptional regulator n=1 Tax=Planosporangium thailandense TaxID=765197 RepID=UPI00197BDECE
MTVDEAGAVDRATRVSSVPSVDDVIGAATRHYLRGEPIDMSELAVELGMSRATLYRRVGNHERLVGLVLAGRTERTYREASAGVRERGPARVLAVLNRFMHAVLATEPLKRFIARDPVLYIRVATAPGPIEQRSTELIAAMLREEIEAGHLQLRVPADVMAQAIVRVADSFMYAHLLGHEQTRIDTALEVIALLVDAAPAGGSFR